MGWLDLFPDDRTAMGAISLFSSAVSVVGGRNFLRRWVFDGGYVAWSVGYSVTVHRRALTETVLSKIVRLFSRLCIAPSKQTLTSRSTSQEYTWSTEYEPLRPFRPALAEGHDKLTYYLHSITRLSPTLATFHHRCTHASVQDGLREIDIVWDSSEEPPKSSMAEWWWGRLTEIPRARWGGEREREMVLGGEALKNE
jgi:hypothetical protein